jgi:hypothetical protein
MQKQNIETIFSGRVSDGDLTWVTLRGHVFVEAMLRRSIQQRVAHPETVDKVGLKYAKLVHLAITLDAIPSEFTRVLFKLDSLRNALGHELVVEIDWKQAYGLAEALPKRWFNWLDQRYDGDEKTVHYVRDVVNLLVLILYFGDKVVFQARDSAEISRLRDRFREEVLENLSERKKW